MIGHCRDGEKERAMRSERPRLGYKVRKRECIECVALLLVNCSLMLKHRHTQASIYSHIRFVSPDQQCWYELQFVDLRYYKQHNRRKDGFHFNKRNCFSLELEAEIINMKRKTKAQIYRDYKYNIKMFVWNTLYLLERQRSHETQSTGP